jgi:hypothetical protein
VKLTRKLLNQHAFEVLVTDKLRSYSAAKSEIGVSVGMKGNVARTIGLRTRISRHNGVSATLHDLAGVTDPPVAFNGQVVGQHGQSSKTLMAGANVELHLPT